MFLVWLSPAVLVFILLYLVVGFAYARITVERRHPLDQLIVLLVTLTWPFVIVKRLTQ